MVKVVVAGSMLVIIPTETIIPIKNNYIKAADDDWQYAKKRICPDEKVDPSTDPTEKPTGDVGDWLTEGSEAHAVAQKIFDYATKELGMSGAFTAGMLANVQGESKFIPDLGENAYDKPFKLRRFGMNNKTPTEGMGPSTATQAARYGYQYFGGGLFQFTPWQKFADSKWWGMVESDGWAPENQVQFIWDNEFANKTVHSYYQSNIASNASSGASAAASRMGQFSSVEDAISTNDPAKAQMYFQIGYERPQWYHEEREEWAKQANSVFNKENIKADPSKWKFADSSSEGIDGNTSVEEDKKLEEECGIGKEDEGGSFADWGDDGTGSYTGGGFVWRPEELPEELKKYAMDPTSVDMKWHSPEGWHYHGRDWQAPGHQGAYCNNLASSMLYAVWHKKGDTSSRISLKNGTDGVSETKRAAQITGGKVTKKPKKGALISVPSGLDGTTNLGHVMFMSHVFKDGSALVIEQNFAGKSGAANGGEAYSWNYRFVRKNVVDSYTYYYPGDDGYVPDKRLKMLK